MKTVALLAFYAFLGSLFGTSIAHAADSAELQAYKKQAIVQYEEMVKKGEMPAGSLEMMKEQIQSMTEDDMKQAREMDATMKDDFAEMPQAERAKKRAELIHEKAPRQPAAAEQYGASTDAE
jgi:hypothetical protein